MTIAEYIAMLENELNEIHRHADDAIAIFKTQTAIPGDAPLRCLLQDDFDKLESAVRFISVRSNRELMKKPQ